MYHHDNVIPFTLAYLLPAVKKCLPPPPASIYELGCGNGSTARALIEGGYQVKGLDASEEGIARASHYGEFRLGSVYDDLSSEGTFDVVLSLEVIEHLTNPRRFAHTVKQLMKPEGIAIISTPYHGYIKNLTISLTNKWDSHLSPLWDGGHIKMWTLKSINKLFAEAGMHPIDCHKVGRLFTPLAKSMVVCYCHKSLSPKLRLSNGIA